MDKEPEKVFSREGMMAGPCGQMHQTPTTGMGSMDMPHISPMMGMAQQRSEKFPMPQMQEMGGPMKAPIGMPSIPPMMGVGGADEREVSNATDAGDERTYGIAYENADWNAFDSPNDGDGSAKEREVSTATDAGDGNPYGSANWNAFNSSDDGRGGADEREVSTATDASDERTYGSSDGGRWNRNHRSYCNCAYIKL